MFRATWLLAVLFLATAAFPSRLLDLRQVDEDFLSLSWQDGVVRHLDNGKGPSAFLSGPGGGNDRVIRYGSPLDVVRAVSRLSYEITSPDDPDYRQSKNPGQCFRRSKVNGTAWGWPDPEVTLEHTIYLWMPHKLKQGKHYTIRVDVDGSPVDRKIAFDVFKNVSEAVHVNIVGYNPGQPMKSADLYMWMGDGKSRNYAPLAGRRAILVDTKTGVKHPVGKVAFWKPSGPDVGKWNLTASPVWNCDFSSFKGSGTFRLAVEGIGCSSAFKLSREAYWEPYKTSLRGFYYMRIGEPRDMKPTPRQPRFIPGRDPQDFKVILTTYGPWHPDWKKAGGDQWDNKDWSKYAEPGNPTNPNAWGGHSDAADGDRHLGHISIIWDMLLPYVLTNGALDHDNLNIRESGNGIPDLIDEARNEVDLWLRLRDRQGGYSTGLNNPSPDFKVMYQAAAKPYMAWANAANAAMLADCFRIAGKKQLADRYRLAAQEAWKIAAGMDLDTSSGIGNGVTRGRDLKMMAAAFLYNLTGNRTYEDAMAKESVIVSPTSTTESNGKYGQLWGTAAYLMCAKYKWQPIHHPALLANMRSAVVAEAFTKNVAPSKRRPSRRSTDEDHGWFQTVQEVQRVCVAHAISSSTTQKIELMKALILEADWGLGRNPMNMVQMTGLGSRHPAYVYTSGSNDGFPESHPGHTPYMNAEPWGSGFMFDPKYYARLGYPAWENWPHGEALWPAMYCFANNEFTPQQTMRGKMCLLAYLYATR